MAQVNVSFREARVGDARQIADIITASRRENHLEHVRLATVDVGREAFLVNRVKNIENQLAFAEYLPGREQYETCELYRFVAVSPNSSTTPATDEHGNQIEPDKTKRWSSVRWRSASSVVASRKRCIARGCNKISAHLRPPNSGSLDSWRTIRT